MNKSNPRPVLQRLRTGALALVLSMLLLPVCAYVAGVLVVGEYEGPSGLLGYFRAVFADALLGRWMAWILIMAPVMIVALWAIVMRIVRLGRTPAPEPAN